MPDTTIFADHPPESADIVFEDDHLSAFRDISPQAPVHVLFVPKTPIATLNDVQPGQAEVMAARCRRGELRQPTRFRRKGYRIVMTATATVARRLPDPLHLLAGAPWPLRNRACRFGSLRKTLRWFAPPTNAFKAIRRFDVVFQPT